MSNNIYNILGKLKTLTESAETTTPEATVYENVEPRGSITEAVRSLESKFATFKEAKAKPDFLDVDKDGDKAEPFKKAVKDKKAKQVDEGQGPYELYNPKHPKFKANHDKWMKKNPGKKLADFVAAMKKKEATMNEAAYDEPAAPDADAVAKRKRLQALKDKQEDERAMGGSGEKNTPIRKVAGKAYGGAAQKDAPEAELDEMEFTNPGEIGATMTAPVVTPAAAANAASAPATPTGPAPVMPTILSTSSSENPFLEDDLDEVAPPGAKAERMVKHIKKGYAKDGKLSKKEKGIAYATAWKAKKEGNLEEATEFGDTIKNSAATMKKAKPAMVKESRVMEETDYFYEKIGKALAEKNPHLDTAGGEFVDAVRKEMVAQGIQPNRARNILMMDEDFISDVASSYGHYCSVDAHHPLPAEIDLGNTKELDEIARLAGLPVQETDMVYNEVNHEESADTMDEGDELLAPPKATPGKAPSAKATGMAPARPGVPPTPTFNEEEVEEGNEFSGALAAAKASGAKEFEVDGKKYTVKEDINVNITANGQEDALNLFRKLAGMDEVVAQPAIQAVGVTELPQDLESALAQGVIEPVEEERDIEYANTPNEKIGPVSAAIPSGDDMHKSKQSYSDKPYRGDNPMAVKEDTLWKKYAGMLKGLIK